MCRLLKHHNHNVQQRGISMHDKLCVIKTKSSGLSAETVSLCCELFKALRMHYNQQVVNIDSMRERDIPYVLPFLNRKSTTCSKAREMSIDQL